MPPHPLPGLPIDWKATFVDKENHPSIFVLFFGAPIVDCRDRPSMRAPRAAPFVSFGVGTVGSIGAGSSHRELQREVGSRTG